MSDKPTPLKGGSIASAIEKVCQEFSSLNQHGWIFSPAQSSHFAAERSKSNSASDDDDNTLLHGIVANHASSNGDNTYLATFFLAYSTWDGRCLTRDFTSGPTDPTDTPLDWFPILAKVAVTLECQRLVWYHHGPKGDDASPTRSPERLPGWLTLHWSVPAMQAFTGTSTSNLSQSATGNNANTIGQRIEQQLQEISRVDANESKFSVRLASAKDVQDIVRLVHGLAIFEKEPESVHVGAEHFIADGGQKDDEADDSLPLYYCLLIDAPLVSTDGEGDQKASNTETTGLHTCGMAFCYVGHNLKGGRFWYLEDLFIEEAYRGQGVGTIVMKTLARLALSLDCQRVKWQALDWNTPAITFYNKIGARVQDGLETSRFVGEGLRLTSSSSPS